MWGKSLFWDSLSQETFSVRRAPCGFVSAIVGKSIELVVFWNDVSFSGVQVQQVSTI